MFIAALITVVKIWKQPKCPLTEEWIKKMWYIYSMDYYSAISVCNYSQSGPKFLKFQITS